MRSYRVSKKPSGEWEAKNAELRVCIASSLFTAVYGDVGGVW